MLQDNIYIVYNKDFNNICIVLYKMPFSLLKWAVWRKEVKTWRILKSTEHIRRGWGATEACSFQWRSVSPISVQVEESEIVTLAAEIQAEDFPGSVASRMCLLGLQVMTENIFHLMPKILK